MRDSSEYDGIHIQSKIFVFAYLKLFSSDNNVLHI